MSYVRERNGVSYFEVVRRVELLDRGDLRTKFVRQGKFTVTCNRIKLGPQVRRSSRGTKDRHRSPEL